MDDVDGHPTRFDIHTARRCSMGEELVSVEDELLIGAD